MDKVIDNVKKIPLSNDDISTACSNKTKIVKYSDLINYKNINELLEPYGNFVLLYETSPGFGHWVCVIKHSNYIEFFDPLGYEIDQQLDFINIKFKRESNQSYPILSHLISRSGYKLISNSNKLQENNKSVSTCGRHIIMRINLRNLPLDKYLKMFRKNKYDPDKLVTYLTAFIN